MWNIDARSLLVSFTAHFNERESGHKQYILDQTDIQVAQCQWFLILLTLKNQAAAVAAAMTALAAVAAAAVAAAAVAPPPFSPPHPTPPLDNHE